MTTFGTEGAPKGNQFWRARSKHGRDRIFKTGNHIREAVDEYLELCYNNPLMEHDFVGKDAHNVERKKFRIPTWQRFAIFCHVNTVYFNHLKANCEGSEDPIKKDISKAIASAHDIFYSEKLEAASAGLANPQLITRVLGLVDKVETTDKTIKVTKKVIAKRKK